MILKSFFRKKITKVYFIVLFVIFLILFLVNISCNILNKMENDIYLKHSYFFINSNNDIVDILKNIKNIHKIEKSILFEKYEGQLGLMLTTFQLKGTLVNSNGALKDNEAIIIVRENDYINNQDYLNSLVNNNIKFKHLGKDLVLNIKEIKTDVCLSKIVVSEDLFSQLDINNNYIINVDKKGIEKKFFNKINTKVINIGGETEDELKYRLTIEKLINNLSIANYVLIFIFGMMVIIINKNILTDLQDNIDLEYNLGFKKYQIRLNIFKRLFLLHMLAFIFALLICLLVFIIFFLIFKTFFLSSKLFLMFIFILLSDLLMSSVKLKKG